MSSPARSTNRLRRGLLLVVATVLAGVALWGPAAAAAQAGDGGTPSGAVTVDPAHREVAADEPAGTVDGGSVGLLALVSAVCLTGAAVGVAQTLTVKRAYAAERA